MDAITELSLPLDGQFHNATAAVCAHCASGFTPRTGTGGRPQKYCGEECRRAADADKKANAANAGQRAKDGVSGADADTLRGEIAPTPTAKQISGIPPEEEWRPLIFAQREVTIHFDDAHGQWVLTQHADTFGDNQTIRINEDRTGQFLDELTDAMGVPTFGAPSRSVR